MTDLRKAILILALATASLDCGSSEPSWITHPMPVGPDRSCRYGSDYALYIWNCYQGQRIVVFKRCTALTGCRKAQKQFAACGGQTDIERQIGEGMCNRPVPVGDRWPPSGKP